ncbi:hypothetical protein [Parapedobacter sp.]
MTLSIQIPSLYNVSLPQLLDTIHLHNFNIDMMEEILEQKTQEKQPIVVKTTSSTAKRRAFSPSRFSVKGLRKHPGIQTSRNPMVFG